MSESKASSNYRHRSFATLSSVVCVLSCCFTIVLGVYGIPRDTVRAARTLVIRGRSFLLSDRQQDAKVLFKIALDLDPGNEKPLSNLGYLLLEGGDFRDACRVLQVALNQNPTKSTYLNLGCAYDGLGNPTQGLACFRSALDLDPGCYEAWVNIAQILEAMGNTTDAERAYRSAIDSHPKSSFAWQGLGMLDLQAGRLQAAEEAARTSIRLDPRCHECYYALGLILKAVGNKQEANSAFRRAVELNVHDAGAWYELAQLENERGLTSDGIASLRTALIANPKDAMLWAALARLLIVDTNRFQEARDCVSEAVKLAPNSGAAQEVLGDVLSLRADSKLDAVNAYRCAVELFSRTAQTLSVTRLTIKLSAAGNPTPLDTNARNSRLLSSPQ